MENDAEILFSILIASKFSKALFLEVNVRILIRLALVGFSD